MNLVRKLAGDVSVTGKEILVKTQDKVMLYDRPAGTNLWDALAATGRSR